MIYDLLLSGGNPGAQGVELFSLYLDERSESFLD